MVNSLNNGDNSKISEDRRRKRISRIKTAIIITVLVLSFVPTLLCIILGIRLYKLQKQIKSLMSTDTVNTEFDDKFSIRDVNGNFAYAYEMNEDKADDNNPDSQDYGKYDINSNCDTYENGKSLSGTGTSGNTGAKNYGNTDKVPGMNDNSKITDKVVKEDVSGNSGELYKKRESTYNQNNSSYGNKSADSMITSSDEASNPNNTGYIGRTANMKGSGDSKSICPSKSNESANISKSGKDTKTTGNINSKDSNYSASEKNADDKNNIGNTKSNEAAKNTDTEKRSGVTESTGNTVSNDDTKSAKGSGKTTGVKDSSGDDTESDMQASSSTKGKTDKKATESNNSPDKTAKEKVTSTDNKNSSENEKKSKGKYSGKKVYLTFDDGPSKNTDKILDILAEYNIKATFFVTGHTDEASLNRYKRIVEEGHTLGMHSYSHDYKKIYNSVEDFDKDFTKLWKLLYDTTGYIPTLYRFPGGSLNKVSKNDMKDFIRYLNEKGITYYDWNVVNGDAEGKDYTEEEMIDKVLSGIEKKKISIVLMHDSKGKDKTVTTLPKILDALISEGSQLLPFDENVPLIQQIKASSVK